MFASLRHSLRLARAAFVLARHDISLPDALKAQIPAPATWLGRLARTVASPPDTQAARPDRLSAALVGLGPAYVKLGQFLATRPDILGPSLAADLASLQDKMAPFGNAEARRAVIAAFAKPPEALFAEFGPPIAAASVAQVHRARLHGENGTPGREVAVKVLRPGVGAAFKRDLAAFAFAARQIERWWPDAKRLEPVKLVETLAESVAIELDLRLEGAAASEMAERTAADPEFRVPAVEWTLTAQSILTTEWIDGISLSDPPAVHAAGHDLAEVAALLMRAFLIHALRDGVFHADMHPGNLFVCPGLEDGPPVIAAVDFGIIGRLDRPMRRFMAETLYGFLTRDYLRIADAHFEVGFVSETKSRDSFAQALRAVGEPVFGRPADAFSMADLLRQLFEITRMFDMRMQPQLVMLQKTMVVVEGVARSLDPHINLWEVARPVVETWMTRELGPEARVVDAAETAVSFARAARRAPQVLDKMELAVDRLNAGSERADANHGTYGAAQAARDARIALWISAAALAAIALAALG